MGEILFVFVPIYLPAHLFESGSTDLFEKIFLGRIFVVVIASNKVLKKELNGERGLLLRVKCRVGKKAACLVILRSSACYVEIGSSGAHFRHARMAEMC